MNNAELDFPPSQISFLKAEFTSRGDLTQDSECPRPEENFDLFWPYDGASGKHSQIEGLPFFQDLERNLSNSPYL